MVWRPLTGSLRWAPIIIIDDDEVAAVLLAAKVVATEGRIASSRRDERNEDMNTWVSSRGFFLCVFTGLFFLVVGKEENKGGNVTLAKYTDKRKELHLQKEELIGLIKCLCDVSIDDLMLASFPQMVISSWMMQRNCYHHHCHFHAFA